MVEADSSILERSFTGDMRQHRAAQTLQRIKPLVKILLVANDRDELKVLLQSTGDHQDVGCLALWPDVVDLAEQSGLQILTPDALFSNDDHKRLGDLVVDISNNWWAIFFPDKVEFKIGDYAISDIYRYEVEIGLSALLFKLVTLKKAIDLLRPREIVFVRKRSAPESMLCENWMLPFSLVSFIGGIPVYQAISESVLGDRLPEIRLIEPNRGRVKPNTWQRFSNKISKLFYRMAKVKAKNVIRVLNTRLRHRRMMPGSIVVTGSWRCLGLFLDAAQVSAPICYLDDAYLGKPVITEHLSGQSGCQQEFDHIHCPRLTYEGLSLAPLIRKISGYILDHWQVSLGHYEELKKIILEKKPALYITQSGCGSLNRLNILAFIDSNVRTVWHMDGLGQYSEDVWKVVESAYFSSSPAEKFLVSDFSREQYKKRGFDRGVLRVTGYLGEGFGYPDGGTNGKVIKKLRNRMGVQQSQHVILYATSVANPMTMRFFSEETVFEILKGIQDIVTALANRSRYKVVIKLHPGVRQEDKRLIEERIGILKNIELLQHDQIKDLIELADIVVVYHSSVGLEALFRGKHLIIYDHTGRPSYLTEVYPGLNKDPRKGPCARLAQNKEELRHHIEDIIANSSDVGRSPGLEYYLENAKPDYDTRRVVQQLMGEI